MVVIAVHVSVLFPVLLIVSVLVAVSPTVTSPNAISLDSAMMRVDDWLGIVVTEGAVGDVGPERSSPQADVKVAAMRQRVRLTIRITVGEFSEVCVIASTSGAYAGVL